MCALHKGGTRKVKERFELYFNLGVDVLSGKENWAESLGTGKAPHELIVGSPAPAPHHSSAPAPHHSSTSAPHHSPKTTPPVGKVASQLYKRWKPS
jgi:hypothetical protein